jgi:hypothetical protein
VTKLTTPAGFDALLMKLQRALRGADDLDAASALIALLFHRLTLLDDEARRVAHDGLEALLRVTANDSSNITLTEAPRRKRLLRVTH